METFMMGVGQEIGNMGKENIFTTAQMNNMMGIGRKEKKVVPERQFMLTAMNMKVNS
jgi:hypothetical protein